jgi:hypothetical protein
VGASHPDIWFCPADGVGHVPVDPGGEPGGGASHEVGGPLGGGGGGHCVDCCGNAAASAMVGADSGATADCGAVTAGSAGGALAKATG